MPPLKRETLSPREPPANHGDHLGMVLFCALGLLAFVLVAALSGCGVQDIGGGAGLNLPGLDVVRQCDVLVDDTASEVEFCSDMGDRDLEDALVLDRGYTAAVCYATPRHLGPCLCGEVSNAHNGSLCSGD